MEKITVKNTTYDVEMEFTVLWAAWECDSKAWIVKDGDTNQAVMTNHGRKYFAKEEDLRERLIAYSQVISQTKKAINLLQQPQTHHKHTTNTPQTHHATLSP